MKAIAAPFVEAVKACASLSSESEGQMSRCCECHTRTVARDLDDEEISVEDKPG